MDTFDAEKRIVFQNDDGGVSIIIPCDCGLTIDEIAKKDVPTGKAFAIVDVADIPSDRALREEWKVNAEDLKDGIGE